MQRLLTVHPSRGADRWELSTVLSTGGAAGLVGAVLTFGLHGGPALVVLVGLATAIVVGMLAGYRPLHERDHDQPEG